MLCIFDFRGSRQCERGYGPRTFPGWQDCEYTIEASPFSVLNGHVKIDPKRAIPRQEHQRATKLFIGGLAGSVTSESMREFFSQFGKVIDSTVMLDRETGRSKGFGFVSFEDTNVQPFLGFGNLEIDGKLASVLWAVFLEWGELMICSAYF